METQREIKKISLIGLGAMGSFFAPRLAAAYPEGFRVIAGGARKERLETRGVTLNGTNYKFPVVSPEAKGDPADLILIGVKGYALSQAMEDIRNQVGENTLILSLLNGVDSEERLIEEFGEAHVLYAYMRMSIVMKDGQADFDPYWGKIHFGEKTNREYSERVQRVKEVFDQADIPYEIDGDMLWGIWFKYMCNIGENMTCALLGIPFGVYRTDEDANWIRKNAMREVAAIARKKGISIGEREIELQEATIKSLPYFNKPSTLQDLEAGKLTEVEMFAGTVVRMGRELQVPTPINEIFWHGIRTLERKEEDFILEGLPEAVNGIREGTAILFGEWKPRGRRAALHIEVEFHEEERLIVRRKGSRIHILCHQPAHYFRGLNWALHHLEGEEAAHEEQAFFEQHGFMLDCSRNAVSTVQKVKELIRILARLGMNELLLYTEDTYQVPEEPYFGAYRGRYSREEIREMDEYARIFGIELVPCIQTLAHLRNALRWPAGEELRDTKDILLVGEEQVYVFLEKLLRSVRDSFSTRRVHLGMDEALELGLGNYLRKNGYRESSAIIREHCSRVLAICKKLGLQPMMWSDMYICSNTGKGYYDITGEEDTTHWVKPEDGLGLIYWDYYHDDEAIYKNELKVHKTLTNDVTFAGGAWIWNGISPNYSKAFACTRQGLRACREQQIRHVFCTGWMDNGAETPVDAVYPGLVLFAHLGFHREVEEEQLREEFQNAVNARWEDFCLLDRFDSLFVGEETNITEDNPSKYLLYQDTLLGMFDYHIQGIDMAAYYGELAKRLEGCGETSPAYSKLFQFYRLLAEILAEKADLGIRVKAAYDNRDLDALEEISGRVILSLLEKTKELKLVREELWLRDAKPFGYELLDIKLGGVITRLESGRRRIRAYLAGAAERLEELEQPRLPYFPTEQSLHHGRDVGLSENKWDRIVSACALIDTI